MTDVIAHREPLQMVATGLAAVDRLAAWQTMQQHDRHLQRSQQSVKQMRFT